MATKMASTAAELAPSVPLMCGAHLSLATLFSQGQLGLLRYSSPRPHPKLELGGSLVPSRDAHTERIHHATAALRQVEKHTIHATPASLLRLAASDARVIAPERVGAIALAYVTVGVGATAVPSGWRRPANRGLS